MTGFQAESDVFLSRSALALCQIKGIGCKKKLRFVLKWLRSQSLNLNMAPSSVWTKFIKVNIKSAKCKMCGVVVQTSGNTRNLWNHLRRKHPDCASENTQKPNSKQQSNVELDEDVDDPGDTSDQVVELRSNSPTASASSGSVGTSGCTKSSSNSIFSPETSKTRKMATSTTSTIEDSFRRISCFSPGGYMTSVLNEALMYLVIKDCMPLDIVEGEGFKNFIKKAVPLYSLPSRRTLTRMIDAKYDIIQERVKKTFSTIDRFNLTGDIWTHQYTTQSYLGVTVHYLDGIELTSATIGVAPLNSSHDAQYIAKIFMKTCEEWHIDRDKVDSVVTDHAANIVAGVRQAFGLTKQIGCFAHRLNLVAESAIEKTRDLVSIRDKVKGIVTFFKQSVVAADSLKKAQLNTGRTDGTTLKLIQSVPTRWNSTYLMLHRFIELSDIVGTVLLKHTTVSMLTGSELLVIKEVCRVLKPLYNATVELSAEQHTTISKIIPMMNLMKQLLRQMEFDPDSVVASKLRDELTVQIDNRFGKMEHVEMYALSTLLDPRFKKIHFLDPVAHSKAVTKLSDKVNALQRTCQMANDVRSEELSSTNNTDSGNLWSLHNAMVASTSVEPDNPGGVSGELRQFLNSPLSPLAINQIQTWESLKTVYPYVYQLARQYLSRVATSVPSERLFSKAGNTASEHRSRLTGKRLSKLLFLSSLNECVFF